MSTVLHKTVILGLLLAASPVHAQQADHLLTIADCPAGYTLGLQESDQLQPFARAQDYMPPRTGQETVATAQEVTAAPRAFITGCIPPQRRETR